jgi:hypothetical protein
MAEYFVTLWANIACKEESPGRFRIYYIITEHVANLVAHIHDIHDYARQHLKIASDRMKTQYDKLANSAGYHEGNRVWLYRPKRKKGNSPKLQPAHTK